MTAQQNHPATPENLPAQQAEHPLETFDIASTCQQLVHRSQMVKTVLDKVMQKGVHYGKVPGTDGISLLKPGAEKLLSAFQIAPQYEVIDLSGKEVHYRVIVTGVAMRSGMPLGQGIGECSSREEKYAWRSAVNEAEYHQFLSKGMSYARTKWKRGWQGAPDKEIMQVRVDPLDKANTILKMAKKRALSDFCMTALAASDIFELEADQPEEHTEPAPRRPAKQARQQQRPAPQPQGNMDQAAMDDYMGYSQGTQNAAGTQNANPHYETQAEPVATQQPAQTQARTTITDEDYMQLLKHMDFVMVSEEEICERYGIKELLELPVTSVDDARAWLKSRALGDES